MIQFMLKLVKYFHTMALFRANNIMTQCQAKFIAVFYIFIEMW